MKNFSAKVLSENFQYYFPSNIQNAFRAFETSWETDNLDSENNRNIYGELIDWKRRDSNCIANKKNIQSSSNVTTDNGNIDDYEQSDKNKTAINGNKPKWWTEIELKGEKFIESLSLLCLKTLAENFRSGSIDKRIFCHDQIMIGNKMKLDILLTGLFELENETYWKRVVESKIQDKFRLENSIRNSTTFWKQIGIELLYTEFIEQLQVSDIESPTFRAATDYITERCKDYIECLKIRRVNAKKDKIKNVHNSHIISNNYKDEEVTRISLEFLEKLINIKHFSISFDPKIPHENYERRFFQVSVHDIRNLSKSLKNFIRLETLEVSKTCLEQHEKIHVLLSSIDELRYLRILALMHCNISSKESGALFKLFISNNTTLKEINLKDNALDIDFCREFSVGIEKFKSTLDKLVLSMNPILHNGLEFIVNSISRTDNVVWLDISSCDGFFCTSYDSAFEAINNLISVSKRLKHLNLHNNIISSKTHRRNFVKELENNFSISTISYSNCDFSTKEELNIHILLLRNEYYKQNEILQKETFTCEDEIEIEKWLRRTKHPLLVNAKAFMPTENLIKWKHDSKLCQRSEKDFENSTYFYASSS